MSVPTADWHILPDPEIPCDWIETVKTVANLPPNSGFDYGAKLLWLRDVRTVEQLQGFLHADCYQPTSPLPLGPR
jgi:hypothetical protein